MFLSVLLVSLFGVQANAWQSPLKKELKTMTVIEKIPFETTYIDLPNQYRGYSELQRAGVAGEQLIEMQVLYEGERPTRVVSMQSTRTGEPVNEVKRRGTKVLRTQTMSGKPWATSFERPLKTGWISADFYDYPSHNGVDIAAGYGTPVYAAAGGVVTLSGWYGEYGKCVILTHSDGTQTLYAHNSALQVSQGQTVKQGQQLASVGSTGRSTGNHLHFEIRDGGRFLDPLVYIDK